MKIRVKEVGLFYKKRAKRDKIKYPKTGSVTFIQRFGSALNLNVHFHTLFSDGIFYALENGEYEFKKLPPPTREEILKTVTRVRSKFIKAVEKLGLNDQQGLDDESLHETCHNSILQRGMQRLGIEKEGEYDFSDEKLKDSIGIKAPKHLGL